MGKHGGVVQGPVEEFASMDDLDQRIAELRNTLQNKRKAVDSGRESEADTMPTKPLT